MAYVGSEAYRLDGFERRAERQGTSHAPFSVVEGEGLDARARQGVAPRFLSRVRVFMACAAIFVVLGACRVALTTATVTCLRSNSTLTANISTAQKLNDELQMERSVLSSSSRIDRIATEVYGMVYPTSTDTISLGAPVSPDAQASADGAQGTAVDETDTSES